MPERAAQFTFRRTPAFRRSFEKLTAKQKKATEAAFGIFRFNPYDPRLRTHIIQRLSALEKRSIMSSTVEADLRVVWYREGNVIVSMEIGTHKIYQ